MRRIAVALMLAGPVSACSKPNTPTPHACETNNSGTITFGNRSTRQVYEVIWDGALIIPRLEAGTTSMPRDAAAGVAHSLVFRYAEFQSIACASSPILVRCQPLTQTCDR